MTTMLFAVCVLPGCSNAVIETGEVCHECMTAFGPWLRPTARPQLTAEQIAERDRETRAAYAAQKALVDAKEPERKANQICWLCEERRTCTKRAGGWECVGCQP